MSHNLNHFSTHEEYKSGIFPMAFARQAKIQRLPIFCSLAIKKRIDTADDNRLIRSTRFYKGGKEPKSVLKRIRPEIV
jgi:hypothetical protein